METFYGLAAAIKPNQQKIQITEIEGKTKKNIFIRDAIELPFYLEDIESLRRAYDEIFSRIEELVHLQVAGGSEMRLPVVHGWPIGFQGEQLLQLCTHVRGLYSSLFPTDFYTNIQTVKGQSDMLAKLFQNYIGCRTSMKVENIMIFTQNFEPPDTSKHDLAPDLKDLLILKRGERELRELLLLADLDRGEKKKELQLLAKGYGKDFAKACVFGKRRDSGFPMGMFVPVVHSVPIVNQSFLANYPAHREYLREAFAEGFIEELGVSCNFCIKFFDDPKSPGFANVVAAIIADEMDYREYEELRPAEIVLKHPEGAKYY